MMEWKLWRKAHGDEQSSLINSLPQLCCSQKFRFLRPVRLHDARSAPRVKTSSKVCERARHIIGGSSRHSRERERRVRLACSKAMATLGNPSPLVSRSTGIGLDGYSTPHGKLATPSSHLPPFSLPSLPLLPAPTSRINTSSIRTFGANTSRVFASTTHALRIHTSRNTISSVGFPSVYSLRTDTSRIGVAGVSRLPCSPVRTRISALKSDDGSNFPYAFNASAKDVNIPHPPAFATFPIFLCAAAIAAAATLFSNVDLAEARLSGVNRPELLPKGEFTTVIDAAGFLSPGQESRLAKYIEQIEEYSGFKLRILAQNYPETPGLAIKDYWGVDDETIVFVADPSLGNILNFNVGSSVDLSVPRSFWSRVAGKYGNIFYWRENGEDASIEAAVAAIDACLKEPEGPRKCAEVK